MNTRHRLLLGAGLVALSAAASVLAAPALPEWVVSHWNAAGEPDGTMAKSVMLALLPAVSAALLGLFVLVPRIDPLRENIAAFRTYYDWFVVLFAAYLLVLHLGVIAFNLGYSFDFTAFVLIGVAVLFYYLGILLAHARRNWFVGIRTPWTLSSDEVWERTHALGSQLFKLSALVALVGLAFGDYAIYFLIGPALLTAAATIVYSYVVYERIERESATSPGG